MRILYVTDGSAGAKDVAHFLSQLPHRRDVHVHIVTAVDIDDVDPEKLTRAGEDVLIAAQEALGDFPGHVTTGATFASEKESIVQTILVTANYIDADLIAIGASSHSPMSRFFLGSITESIVHYAVQPVLVVRAPIESLKEIIIGVDDSPEANRAACFVASKLPLPSDCTLRLVRAVPPPVQNKLSMNREHPSPEEVLAEGVARIQTEVEELANGMGKDISHTLRPHVIPGSPEIVLLQMAERNHAGLIVVGSHGRTGVERLLFGSISERIVRHAHCSVLVVKHRLVEV